jgi:polysaccharide pyruvyl transferase WcaK-like protein
MRLLVVHAWLRGNLGDVLQLSVLLTSLRELKPDTLDLLGFPAAPAAETGEVLALADRYLADTFPWYWKAAPATKWWLEPRWKRARRALFSRYDAVVCAPGPYLAEYDARAPSALCDIEVATELGLPVVLSCHSIGPLGRRALSVVGRSSARIARESTTYEYLRERGIASCPSADLAFLYPYAERAGRGPIEAPYRVAFLRGNNVRGDALRLEGGALFAGSRLLVESSNDRLVLATSDRRRDGRFLARAARRLHLPWVGCTSVTELVRLVEGSTGVVSDRYHPAICAAALGKPVQVLSNREPHKMDGLRTLLTDRSLEELQGLARAGLHAVRDVLRGAS